MQSHRSSSFQQQHFHQADVATLQACIQSHGQTVENVCKAFKVKSLEELNIEQFDYLMKRMGEK